LTPTLQNKYQEKHEAVFMPPFWPFKRSKKNDDEIDEAPPQPVIYRKGEEVHSKKHSASPEKDDRAYKDALALFGSGDTTVSASTNLAEEYDGVVDQATQPTESSEEASFEWVHHTDGYHYRKKADGQFESTPYVKNGDGTYTPFA